jgi:hypothetical protein
MTQPDTGVEWGSSGFADTDARFAIRGPLVGVAVRDYNGAATNISPHVFNPFSKDGKLRGDLFARRKVGGYWVTNPEPNEGWFYFGANTKDGGPEREPDIETSELETLQSRVPIEVDMTKQGKTVKFTPIESLNPVVRRVRNNRPLTRPDGTILVEDPGQVDYFTGTLLEADFVPRQLLLVRARSRAGGKLYTVEPVPMCKLTGSGAAKMSQEDADAGELTFSLEPDPFFLVPDDDGNLVPGLDGEWVGGKGWTTIGGVPVLSSTAPVATPTTAGKATLAFADPTGTGDPWTIQPEQSPDGTTWTAAELDTPNAVVSASGTTTVKVKGLSAGSVRLRAKVTGTNGSTATTPPSAPITVT